MAAIGNATSDHSSLNLRKTLPAFLIIPTIPSRLKFTRKPAILTMKTKTKVIESSQKLRRIAAGTTSCQRSPRTTNKEMWQQNPMLRKLLYEQQAEWHKERTRMLSELDRSPSTDRPDDPGNQTKMLKMVDPLPYCGRAKELDKFLETLRSNFASHKHLFPRGDPNRVKYAVSFSTPEITTQIRLSDRRTTRTHPSGLAFTNEPQKMYGDKDKRLNSASQTPCRSTSNYQTNKSEFMPTA